eukprot:jgi/Chlat1/4023/Chrsp26S04082
MAGIGRALYSVGFWVRETGQALDRLGCRMQGKYAFKEELSRHRTIMNLFDQKPVVPKDAFVAPNAAVIGDVSIGAKSSVWYGCVLRGDVNKITVGSESNIQDGTIVHVAKNSIGGQVLPTIIGNKVTVGHNAILHACKLEDESFVGMGATVCDGAVVEKGAMVAAGALVKPGTRVPTGQIWGGNPARLLRELSSAESAFIATSAEKYAELATRHLAETSKSFEEIEEDKAIREDKLEREEEEDIATAIERTEALAEATKKN